MKIAVILCLAELSPDKCDISGEMKERCRKLALWYKNMQEGNEIKILFAWNVLHSPKINYSTVVQDFFETLGIRKGNILIFPGAVKRTDDEIQGALLAVRTTGPYDKIFAASTFYHVPRVLALARVKCGVKVSPIFLWVKSRAGILRAILEPAKFFLSILPESAQSKMNTVMRNIGII